MYQSQPKIIVKMPAGVLPSLTSDRRQIVAVDGLSLPSLKGDRDASNRSHTVKEVIFDHSQEAVAKTLQTRGDSEGFYFSSNSIANANANANRNNGRQTMMDPPGYNENHFESPVKHKKRGSTGGDRLSVSKDKSKDPDTTSSVHRRRKRLLEEKARKIIGGNNNSSNNSNFDDNSGKRVIAYHNPNDDTTRTGYTASSSSDHSSWVPVREVDKDPRNRPVRTAETENRMSQVTAKVREKSVPRKSWQPHQKLAQRHEGMNYSSDNDWVPSEFYRKQQEQKQQEQKQQELKEHQKRSEEQHRQKEYRQQHHQQLREKVKQQRLEQQQQQQQQQQGLTIQVGQAPSTTSPPINSSHLPTPKHQNYQPPLQDQDHRNYKQPLQDQEHKNYKLPLQDQEQVPKAFPWKWQQPPSVIHTITKSDTSKPPLQPPPHVIHTIPKTPNTEVERTVWGSPRQPPSVIHTIPKTPKTPKSPSTNDDYLKRKSMASEMDMSEVVISASDSSSEEDDRDMIRETEENNTILSSLKSIRIKPSKKRVSDISMDVEDSSTILSSFRAMKAKRISSDIQSLDPKERDSDESSTILDSLKALKDIAKKRNSEESDFKSGQSDFDDGFDESLLSASIINKDDQPFVVPNKTPLDQFVIPAIFIRKSGTSDITMDLDATRQMIESQLTVSDEEITFGASTIHNSIITEEEMGAMGPAEKYKSLQERALLERAISGLTNSNTVIPINNSGLFNSVNTHTDIMNTARNITT